MLITGNFLCRLSWVLSEGDTISWGAILWFDCTSNSYIWYENGDNFHTMILKKKCLIKIAFKIFFRCLDYGMCIFFWSVHLADTCMHYYQCHIMQLTKIHLQRYIVNKYVITKTRCGVIDNFKQK